MFRQEYSGPLMSDSISNKLFNDCVITYTIPQIEIIQPGMLICLGAKTLNAVRKAIKEKPIIRV
jgi:hypothetical protein